MSCAHTEDLPTGVTADATDECPDCAALGERHWVHLRQCLTCGHVACCDSSPHKHATAHHGASGHPVMRSHEPGESWRWCYPDNRLV
ncbi:UBP-type zinc finger domain-containing protein [Actinokineospora spheciospongiae]|uniref:UBP-type zinc finger domain-containing protein n=1 Tax=Actinokineospora spheciospongiae TaxID=909613 RepID=UPI000D71CCB8|nr:UBP-type zinc finger domain-containing protein [Actinokineospora spheciospongiae]PWW61772.1 ubiquitin-hydrolase Zn-finger-containing protein [Actinokineospora spheciospongiae]